MPAKVQPRAAAYVRDHARAGNAIVRLATMLAESKLARGADEGDSRRMLVMRLTLEEAVREIEELRTTE